MNINNVDFNDAPIPPPIAAAPDAEAGPANAPAIEAAPGNGDPPENAEDLAEILMMAQENEADEDDPLPRGYVFQPFPPVDFAPRPRNNDIEHPNAHRNARNVRAARPLIPFQDGFEEVNIVDDEDDDDDDDDVIVEDRRRPDNALFNVHRFDQDVLVLNNNNIQQVS